MRAVFVEVVEPEISSGAGRRRGRNDHHDHLHRSRRREDRGRHHQTNVPEMFRAPEAQAGIQTSFDRFAAYVDEL